LKFFDSQASNYIVSIATQINKIKKKISKDMDSESLLKLYNAVKYGAEHIESVIREIEQHKTKEVLDEQ